MRDKKSVCIDRQAVAHVNVLQSSSQERCRARAGAHEVPMELSRAGGLPMLVGALCFRDPGPSFCAETCGEVGEVGDLLSAVLGLDDRFRG